MLPGDQFFIKNNTEQIMNIITAALRPLFSKNAKANADR
jgi:hypothetical protein